MNLSAPTTDRRYHCVAVIVGHEILHLTRESGFQVVRTNEMGGHVMPCRVRSRVPFGNSHGSAIGLRHSVGDRRCHDGKGVAHG